VLTAATAVQGQAAGTHKTDAGGARLPLGRNFFKDDPGRNEPHRYPDHVKKAARVAQERGMVIARG
jgi:hypothetical protein